MYGAIVGEFGIAFNVTRADALESLEQRVAELEEGGDEDRQKDESD